MYKVSIKPHWELQTADGRRLPPHLIELLMAVHATGSLAGACREAKLSYRYAWGLLRESHTLFGAPLMRSTRGRGALLTPLGQRLVWADNCISARLSPTLESLASELETELERGMAADAMMLRVHASQGFGVELLGASSTVGGHALDLKHRSPGAALTALRAGLCDLAGLHLPIGELEGVLLGHYRDRLDFARDRVVHLAVRRQGLVVAPGNPKRLHVLADLPRDGVRFVHRQRGSSTRLLLEHMLAREGLAPADLRGCEIEEPTHDAVAARVAAGTADVGFGLEQPARDHDLDFVPMIDEQYVFVCRESALKSDQAVELLAVMRSAEFRDRVDALSGCDASRSGDVQTLRAAFPSL
jgi:molybdate transport repressor ModE-like protein